MLNVKRNPFTAYVDTHTTQKSSNTKYNIYAKYTQPMHERLHDAVDNHAIVLPLKNPAMTDYRYSYNKMSSCKIHMWR